MMTYILIVIFHVNSGSSGFTQEFATETRCKAARDVLYKERDRVRIDLETAFCVPK